MTDEPMVERLDRNWKQRGRTPAPWAIEDDGIYHADRLPHGHAHR